MSGRVASRLRVVMVQEYLTYKKKQPPRTLP
jgi:hypothetical protein